MGVVDIVVLALLASGLVMGLLRGFLSQAIGLVGTVGGLILATFFYERVEHDVVDHVITSNHNYAIAFVGILLCTVLVVALIGRLLRGVIEKMDVSIYDRIVGAVFGALKIGVLCGALLLALVSFAPNNGIIERAISNSRTGPVLWRVMDTMANALPGSWGEKARKFLHDNPLPPAEEM